MRPMLYSTPSPALLLQDILTQSYFTLLIIVSLGTHLNSLGECGATGNTVILHDVLVLGVYDVVGRLSGLLVHRPVAQGGAGVRHRLVVVLFVLSRAFRLRHHVSVLQLNIFFFWSLILRKHKFPSYNKMEIIYNHVLTESYNSSSCT